MFETHGDSTTSLVHPSVNDVILDFEPPNNQLQPLCSSCNNLFINESSGNLCSNCENIPYITPDDFTIQQEENNTYIQPVNSYPQTTFEHEYSPGFALQENQKYPIYSPYFPAGRIPPPVEYVPIVPSPTPALQNYVYGPSMISPGEQDNYAHKFVRLNRANAQKQQDEIFIKNTNLPIEPYTQSLYQTPYDETKNMISTGKLVNTYSGETFETFENQMPPPTTNKGAALQTQFKHLNPRLLHLTGGFNWHNPPPRKREQPGSVFNPVSARGGASAFGSTFYDEEVRKQAQMYASRDVFNNRDGNQVVEPSMNGDKPHGYFGLVPRNRFQPFVPATQELDTHGRITSPENLNPDLRKREQYTGQVFSRKSNVLVTRASMPNTLINGVEAAAEIPITSDRPGTFGHTQIYITPAFFDGSTYVHHTSTLTGKTASGSTHPIGPIAAAHHQPGQQPIDLHVKSKVNPELTAPGAHPSLPTGGLVTHLQNLRSTGKVGMTDATFTHTSLSNPQLQTHLNLPQLQQLRFTLKTALLKTRHVGNVDSNILGDVIVNQVNLRDTGKFDNITFPLVGINPVATGDLIVSEQTIRDTGKFDNVTFPLVGINPVAKGDLIVSEQTIRDTLKHEASFRIGDPHLESSGDILVSSANLRLTAKTGMVDQTHATAPVSLPFTGDILTSQASVKDTLKINTEKPHRSGALAVVLPQGHVQLDKTPMDTQRMTTALVARHSGPDGSRFGDELPLQLVTSNQVRGVCAQDYITQNKKISDGVGGSTVRVVGRLNHRTPETPTIMFLGRDQDFHQPSSIKLQIPQVRLTNRELTAAQDLEDELEDLCD
jgi:hypothetical protein